LNDEWSAAPSAILLPSGDDEIVPRIPLFLDTLSHASSVVILAAFAVSAVACHSGAFFRNPVNVTHVTFSNSSIFVPLEALQLLNVFSSLTATAVSPSAFSETFHINFGGDSFTRMIRFTVPPRFNLSHPAHILTVFPHDRHQLAFHIFIAVPRHYELVFTSPSTQAGLVDILLSMLLAICLGALFIFYRSGVQREASDDVPSECKLMALANVFLLLGNDFWHFVVPVSPLVLKCITRAVTCVFVWFLRLIIFRLARRRNGYDLSRRRDIAVFVGSAVIDIATVVFMVIGEFRFPAAKAGFGWGAAPMVGLMLWAVMATAGWRSGWLLAGFVAVGVLAEGIAPVVDRVFGGMKETYFACAQVTVPMVVCGFLYLITWPVTEMSIERQRRLFQ
jgi:hypothetical protein